jgi:hypothetical protein
MHIFLGLSLPCLCACGSTVLFSLFLVIFCAERKKITKNKKNLREEAKVLILLFALERAFACGSDIRQC